MFESLKKFLITDENNDPDFALIVRNVLIIAAVGITGLGLSQLNVIRELGRNDLWYVLGSIIGSIFVFLYLSTRGILWPAKIFLPAFMLITLIYTTINLNGLHNGSVAGFPITIMLASLLRGRRSLPIWTILTIISISFVGYWDMAGFTREEIARTTTIGTIGLAITFNLIAAGITYVILSRFENLLKSAKQNEREQIDANKQLQELQLSLETRVAERTTALEDVSKKAEKRANQLQAVTSISRAISTIRNVDELLPSITKIISDRFGFYHVGIFLVDRRGEYAELRAANSSGGQRMLARNHRLRVGEEGIIGYVTKYGRPRIALDVGDDAVFFNNPDLPDTRSEMGLPLIISGDIIGALDVQSELSQAFTPDDIATLNALANQVATAIQNAELYTQAENATREIERAYRSFVQQEWSQVATTMKSSGYSFSNAGVRPIVETDKAYRNNEDGTYVIPVTLRGEPIGEIGMRSAESQGQWSENEIAILRAAADRVALALENARLFQDAQQRAATERAISEMSSKIGASVDVDAILQSTVQELSQLVGSSEIIIQLGKK